MENNAECELNVTFPPFEEEIRLAESKLFTETPIYIFSFAWLIEDFYHVVRSPTLLNQQRLTVRTEQINRIWDISLEADRGSFKVNCKATECNMPIRVSLEVILPNFCVPNSTSTPIKQFTDEDKLLNFKVSMRGIAGPYEILRDRNEPVTIKFYVYTERRLHERQLGSVEQLVNDMASLYKTGSSSSDFNIQTKDNDKGFLVHKAVVSARSPVFAAMIQSDYKEGKSGVVRVPDVSSDTMELLLAYVYTGNIKKVSILQPKDIIDLAYAAAKYALVHLLDYCDEVLADKVNKDNAADLISMAENLNLSKSIKFIGKYMDADKVNDKREEEDDYDGAIAPALSKM